MSEPYVRTWGRVSLCALVRLRTGRDGDGGIAGRTAGISSSDGAGNGAGTGDLAFGIMVEREKEMKQSRVLIGRRSVGYRSRDSNCPTTKNDSLLGFRYGRPRLSLPSHPLPSLY